MFKRILACLLVLVTLVSYLPPKASATETQPQEETTEVPATQPTDPETVPTTEPTAAAEETTAPTEETSPDETSSDETLPEEALVDTYALPEDGGTVASGQCGDNLTWSVDAEGTLTISGTGAMWDYAYIADSNWNWHTTAPWDGYSPVKLVLNEGISHIGDSAFEGYSSLTGSLTLPESLTSIGHDAFSGSGFTGDLTLPKGLTSIGSSAFGGWSNLTSVTIPQSVTSIGCNVFGGCVNLESIFVEEGNTAYTSVDGVLFNKNLTTLMTYPVGKKDTTYQIPEGVTEIFGYAFGLCSNLTSVTIPESVTVIDGAAFIECSGLTSMVIPQNVTKIGITAFLGCSGLTSVTIPEGVTIIDEVVFHGCSSLTSVTIPRSVTKIAWGAFQSCSSLTNITIPQNVTEIGMGAFYDCDSLKDVYYAGSKAQWDKIQIEDDNDPLLNAEIHFDPSGSIGSGQCGDNLTWSVDAEGTLTISGTGAMWDYEEISENNGNWRTTAPWYTLYPVKLVLNEGISYIGCYAFLGCSLTGSVTIPKSVTRLGLEAFRDCKNLTDVTIPASLTNIRYGAFNGCTGLTSVAIPEGVPIIDGFAFAGCTGLTSVVIPKSVTRILWGAFSGCTSLKDVYYAGDQSRWNGIVISDSNDPLLNAEIHFDPTGSTGSGECGENLTWRVDADGTLTISGTGAMQDYDAVSEDNIWHTTAPWHAYYPTKLVFEEGITYIGSYAFYKCGFTGGLTLPESLTNIGEAAFLDCSGFTGNLTLPKNLTSVSDWAFTRCSGFRGGLTLPEGLTSIGNYAFWDCSGFTGSLTIPEGVTSIGDHAFDGCNSFTGSLTLPKSLNSIGYGAFQSCYGFTGSLTLPENLTSIGARAFYWCTGFAGSLTLPRNLTSIENRVFGGCSGFTGSLVLPESLTSIDYFAFENCSGFTGNLVLPESLTSIGTGAFWGCSGFTGSLTIPKGLTSMDSAFVDCTGLSNIFVDEGNASYTSVDGVLFNKDCTSLIDYPAGKKLPDYEIPESVTSIGGSAFRDCVSLTSVTIPGSVTKIEWCAFGGCVSLEDVYYVGNQAQWSKIEIEDNNEPLLGAKLHLITGYGTCGEDLTWTLTYDGVLTISGTGEMTDYPNFADVPWNAYREKILSVVMEPGVTSVGEYAFFQCINMTSVEMPEGVTSIGDNAFSACRNLTSAVIPESVTNIGFAAFMACNGLTSVTIPAGVASISSTSFGACFILENIFVDEGNTVYASADGILFNKDQTTLITYPAGKKNTTYIIPEGVTNIASRAVYNCGYLTSVTIPRSVASIGNNAFDFCYNLRDISVDEGNEAYASVDGVLFNKDRTVLVAYPAGKENTAYTIPDGVTNVGRSAFWDCMLTSIVIPESVTKIEWDAFRDCSNLKDVYYVGSQRQWEQVQIAEYNEPLLNAAIHFNSVGPCPELTLDREYITLSVGAEPVQLQSFPEYARKAVVWSVENPDGVNVIEVSGDGCVTPLNAGTAYVVASLNTGDGTLTARCRVDVTGTAGSEDVLGVDLGTKKVTTELYSTDYAKIDILLLLEQNEVALFAMPADNGSAITGAYLEDETARQFFDLRVKDDRQLLLVPTQEALDNAKGVKSSYSSKIVVLVNGVEYHTDDAVTISVKKTMPKLKAANLTFNPFYTEQSQALTITGGTVTKVEGTTPDWLTMDGTKLTLSNAPKSGRASLNLLVYTTEWAIPVNVKASVKLSYKAPRLKLSASSVTLSETDSLGVTLKLTAGKQSLEELNVKSVTLPAGFEDTELNLYTGEIALVPIGEIPTGKQAVRVSFYGTDSVLDLPLRVNKRTPTLRLSKTSVSLNAELGDSMTLKVTATPADLDLAKVTVTNPSEALEVSPVNENGEFTVTVKQGSTSKASYTLMVQAPTGKAVKLTVKTLAAGQKVTMSLKASGSIDLTFPEKGVALQPKYRNYAGELENVVYTLALKQGKVTLDAAFDDYLTIGEDGLIRWNGTGSLESGNICLITMTGELPNGTMLFATAQVRVTQTPVILRLSKASLSLNKRLEEKTQVTVTTSTRGYTLGDVELLVTDNKNVPSDGLTAAYENGLLTLSVNEKTVYGGSYKVQLWVTPKRVTTLMVRIPAEKKSAVTMTARARGGIDVIRDASEVIVTPTYRNCLDGASLKKQVKVTWAQDGRNYSQDVTEDFILTWAQDGTLHVSKVPGKELALTGKYRLEILCEGMEKEAYTALSVKCGTARFTVASVSLYAKDANDMARLTITTTDKTVNTLERVELKDARLKGTYEVLDLGGGQFALCLIPGAKAKTGTVTLNLFCEGNTTAKPSGTVSVKVEIR